MEPIRERVDGLELSPLDRLPPLINGNGEGAAQLLRHWSEHGGPEELTNGNPIPPAAAQESQLSLALAMTAGGAGAWGPPQTEDSVATSASSHWDFDASWSAVSAREPGLTMFGGDPDPSQYYEYQVLVPATYETMEQMYRLFERTAYGREVKHSWDCEGDYDIAHYRGRVVPFWALRSLVAKYTDPAMLEQQRRGKQAYSRLSGKTKQAIGDEATRRYLELSGDKPGTVIGSDQPGKARMWDQQLGEVMKERATLTSLPAEIKELLGKDADSRPQDFPQLCRIAEKLKRFTTEDLRVYKLLAIRATTNLDLFEQSVDLYLARKAELKQALEAQQIATRQPGSMRAAMDQQWAGLDGLRLGSLSEDERYWLAREKTAGLTAAQLQYMTEHPGEMLGDLVETATLANTGETMSAIGQDLAEVASGDANAWARWAAGFGAGAKLSGWLLAVAGVLYVASWLTGVGALDTLLAAIPSLLEGMLTCSLVESELRIKAASQATTKEDFQRQVELAASARSQAIVVVAFMAAGAALKFLVQAAFPEQVRAINDALGRFRERVRLVGSIAELRTQIVQEMGTRRAALLESGLRARQAAQQTAAELDALGTEQFARKMQNGELVLLDQTALPPGLRIDFGEFLKSIEGREALAEARHRLVMALQNEVGPEIERTTQARLAELDQFLIEVEAAPTQAELSAAIDRLQDAFGREQGGKLLAEEQQQLVQGHLTQALQELRAPAKTAEAPSLMEDEDLVPRREALADALEQVANDKPRAAASDAQKAIDAHFSARLQRLLDFGRQGLLQNPEKLPGLVRSIAEGSRQHLQALNDALDRLSKGHRIELESLADVVDHTTQEAIQHKQISSASVDALKDHVRKALSQLAGESNESEKPPPGYKRVADIQFINPENPYYLADGATFEQYLKEMLRLSDLVGKHIDADPNASLTGVGKDLELRITNGAGTFIFNGPDFDLSK